MIISLCLVSGILEREFEDKFGKVYRFQSHNYPKRVMNQRGFEVWIDEFDASDDRNISFIIVKGLTGRGVSFRSLKYPDRYLHQREWLCFVDVFEDTQSFKDNSTFIPRIGLANPKDFHRSFEAINNPGYYIRHSSFRVRVDKYDETDLFRREASWLLIPQGTISISSAWLRS